ncbi:DUF6986 family protein [Nocardioides donggukensis]|uniref:Aldolase n=1 Tax=Nocardioides donggukensis TaxID=2774019 RepID=A0A927KB92_9ACTN|nr:aldolase [Nocardioides donggukensis]MBD8871015.1 aldolase [Nocardioides donggukensis]
MSDGPVHPHLDAALAGLAAELDDRLAEADAALAAGFPGERPGRQPVHTVYVPADAYAADLVPDWGARAAAAVARHPEEFARLTAPDDGSSAETLSSLVRAKLTREPIEDLRIDFEDGYGTRPDEEEDAHVAAAAAALATAERDGTGTPFRGIRCKSLEAPTRHRGLRTLGLFLGRLLEDGGTLDGFVVTLPKVTSVEQVEAMVLACSRLEATLGLPEGALRFEVQVETPQSVLGPDGTALVARMIHASAGRCSGLHYGTYDYSAFCGIAAEHQSLEHAVADHAKLVMQAAAAGTGVRLSDGSTNILPVGEPAAVAAAWALHLRLVRRSLARGYYQGWDLHPAQLPTRFAATYAFYREGFAGAAERLRRYTAGPDTAAGTGSAGSAGGGGGTASGDSADGAGVLDEPATARALADVVVRGTDCGAVTEAEVTAAGLDPQRLLVLARRTPDRG